MLLIEYFCHHHNFYRCCLPPTTSKKYISNVYAIVWWLVGRCSRVGYCVSELSVGYPNSIYGTLRHRCNQQKQDTFNAKLCDNVDAFHPCSPSICYFNIISIYARKGKKLQSAICNHLVRHVRYVSFSHSGPVSLFSFTVIITIHIYFSCAFVLMWCRSVLSTLFNVMNALFIWCAFVCICSRACMTKVQTNKFCIRINWQMGSFDFWLRICISGFVTLSVRMWFSLFTRNRKFAFDLNRLCYIRLKWCVLLCGIVFKR